MKSTLFLSSALMILVSSGPSAQAQRYVPPVGGNVSSFNAPPKYMPTPEEEKLSRNLQDELREVLGKARAAVDAGHVEEALPLFEEAKRVEANSMRVVHTVPDTDPIEEESLIAQKRYSDAICIFEESNQRQGTFSEAWLTVLYWRTGNKSMARQAFHKAFYRKGKLDIHPGLGTFLALNGETDEAMQATALIYIGANINGDGISRVYDQVKLLEEAGDFVPKNPYIAYRIGETYFNARRYKDALPYFQTAKSGMKPYLEGEAGCEAKLFDCKRLIAANQEGG